MSGASRNTKHLQHKIGNALNDCNQHFCPKTGKHWEYRLLKHEVKPGYETEEWSRLENSDWWPDELVSDMGRYRVGDGAPARRRCRPRQASTADLSWEARPGQSTR